MRGRTVSSGGGGERQDQGGTNGPLSESDEEEEEEYEQRGYPSREEEDLVKEEEDDELFNLSEEEEEEEDPLIQVSSRYDRRRSAKPGELATDQELEWLELVEAVREQARAGDVHESVCADAELAAVMFRRMPDARLLGGRDAAVCAVFEETDSRTRPPDDDALAATVEWVSSVFRGDRRVYEPHQMRRYMDAAPVHVDRRALLVVLQARTDALLVWGDRPLDEAAFWSAVRHNSATAIRTERSKERSAKVRPRTNSALIAVYNFARQFAAPGPESSDVDRTDDALRCCCLRSSAPGALRLAPRLFAEDEDRPCWLNLDLEGDVAAVSASPEGSIGVFFPALDDEASVVGRPAEATTPLGPILAEGGCDELSRPRANPGEERVWAFATDRDSWLVQGREARRGGAVVARLEFPVSFKSNFVAWRPTMTRCLDRVIAGLGDSRLYVWSITDALADFERDAYSRARKKARNGASCKGPLATPPPVGSAAREMVVSDDVYWSVGDCQRLTDSAVCLAPAADCRYSSLRVFDARHERTVRLLAGHREAASLCRQHCALSHDLVFSIEPRTAAALVFDLRSAAPAFVLPCCARLYDPDASSRPGGPQAGVLGLPCAGHACFAFTWTFVDQSIRAWDLRRPAFHAYTLSTGNRSVTHLAFHAPSASLFAATKARRRTNTDTWPLDACHHPAYFSDALDLTHLANRALLRYAFDDGRPLTDPRPKHPRPPSWP